jgi:hypothetical protein
VHLGQVDGEAHRPWNRRHGRPREAAKGLVRDPLPVDRVRDRLPHPHVAERRMGQVQDQVHGAPPVDRPRDDRRIGHEALERVRRHVEDQVDTAGAQLEHLGGTIGDDTEHDPRELGRAAPVVGVGVQHDLASHVPALEREGTAADGRPVQRLRAVHRHDRGARVRQMREQRGEGRLADDVDRVRVDGADLAHGTEQPAAGRWRVRLEQALERGHHGGGIEDTTIVEGDALTQVHAQRGGVGVTPRDRETRPDLALGHDPHQRLVDLVGDEERRLVGGGLRVERGRVGADGQHQRLAGGERAAEPEREDGEQGAHGCGLRTAHLRGVSTAIYRPADRGGPSGFSRGCP